MKTNDTRSADTNTSTGNTNGMIRFASTCPKCGQLRRQRGYDYDSLQRLLSRGHPVEAYCSVCDEFWSINPEERAALGVAAKAGGGSVVC